MRMAPFRLISLVLLLCTVELLADVISKWVVSSEKENPVAACSRQGLQPQEGFILSQQSFTQVVVNDLQRQYVDGGIVGCCVPGLWCNSTHCFTQGFGSFSNYGPLPGNHSADFVPVYLCSNRTSSLSNIVNFEVETSGEQLRIQGQNVSGADFVFVDSEACSQIQTCSSLHCSSNSDCPIGEACSKLNNGNKQCLSTCAGTYDSSCSCGTSCLRRLTYLSDSSTQYSFACDYDDESYPDLEFLFCEAPQAYFSSSYEVNISLSIAGSTITLPSTISTDSCSSNNDCRDGNICTRDICVNGECLYDTNLDGCESMSLSIRELVTPFAYHYAVDKSNEGNIFSVLEQMGSRAILGSTSSLLISRQSSLSYFGSIFNSLRIYPQGVVAFPPYPACDVTCEYFDSSSNTIAAFFTGATAETIYVLEQEAGSDISINEKSNGSVHVGFFNNNNVDSAISVFDDGSVQFSFRGINYSTVESLRFSGLWGAFVSKSVARTHMIELDETNILDASTASFCQYSITGCLQNSCVAEGGVVRILTNFTEGCLSTSVNFNLSCIWNGGQNVSNGLLLGNSIECEVPFLNVANNSIVSLNVEERTTSLQLFGVFVEHNETLSSSFMIQYFVGSSPSTCGCNPMHTQMMCQSGVCAIPGESISAALDCVGYVYGSAYIDECDNCVGGTTLQSTESCNHSGRQALNYLTQTIILLVIICCLTLATASVSYTIRKVLIERAHHEAITAAQQISIELIEASNQNGRGRGLSEFEIDALGEIPVSKEILDQHRTSENDGVDCPICLLEIQEGVQCRVLPPPCSHIFHTQCIDPWLKQSTSCPLCKRSVKALFCDEPTVDVETGRSGRNSYEEVPAFPRYLIVVGRNER